MRILISNDDGVNAPRRSRYDDLLGCDLELPYQVEREKRGIDGDRHDAVDPDRRRPVETRQNARQRAGVGS